MVHVRALIHARNALYTRLEPSEPVPRKRRYDICDVWNATYNKKPESESLEEPIRDYDS